MKRLLFVLLFLAIPVSAWAQASVSAVYYVDSDKGTDTASGDKAGSELKSMVGLDRLMASVRATDKISIKGLPAWGARVGEDAERNPIYETREGSLQYFLTGGDKWRTVIWVGKVKLTGISTVGKSGEMETVIDKTEVNAVVDVKTEVVK